MMKTMSRNNIKYLGKSEQPTGNTMVFVVPSPEATVGSTSGAGASRLPNNDWMLLEEEKGNELLGNNRFTDFVGFTIDGFLSDEAEEIDPENNNKNTRMWQTKEVNKILIRCFYQRYHTKKRYRK